jgi:hypothetical protein
MPVQVGGGGRQMLSLAAREADIVGIIAQSAHAGGLQFGRDADALVGEKVEWVRRAAQQAKASPNWTRHTVRLRVNPIAPSIPSPSGLVAKISSRSRDRWSMSASAAAPSSRCSQLSSTSSSCLPRKNPPTPRECSGWPGRSSQTPPPPHHPPRPRRAPAPTHTTMPRHQTAGPPARRPATPAGSCPGVRISPRDWPSNDPARLAERAERGRHPGRPPPTGLLAALSG